MTTHVKAGKMGPPDGYDFQEARAAACRWAAEQGLHYVPSFHPDLVLGSATYALELLSAVPALDTAYVPVGLGSGICGMAAAREALGLKTEIVGVVSAHAPACRDSFLERRPVERPARTELADGLACRVPEPEALELMWRHVARLVTVSDEQVAEAMRVIFDGTHNTAEGAGAAALAGLLSEQSRSAGKRLAAVLSGGNVDREVFAGVLAGRR